MKSAEKIIIVDGNALVHRAFHALPPTMKTKSGQMTNAVYGFVTILFKVLKELKPKYAVVTFDVAKKTFRHEQYKEYKATRKKQPDELYEQIPIVKEIVQAFNIPIFEKEGFEADDVIGTLTKKLDGNLEKFIVTGDMDTLQLVDEHTKVFTLKKGVKDTIVYDANGVKERFSGLTPAQMIDYKAIRGDASDNIPGVKGIGEKGAIELLKKYGTLENIYNNLEKIKGAIHDKLKDHKEEAYLSKKLATIVRDLPLSVTLADCVLADYERKTVIDVLQKYEFKSLLTQFQNVPQFKPQQSLFGETASVTTRHDNYHLIDSPAKIKKILSELKKQKIFALDTETDSLNFINANLVGMSVSWEIGEAYFILREYVFDLKDILENDKIKKVGHNIKYDWHVLDNFGINLQGVVFDTMVAAYLLNPGSRQNSLDKQAFSEFGHEMMTYEDLCGKGKQQIPIKDVAIDKLNYYACEDADYTWRLYKKVEKELREKKLNKLFEDIELPLVSVLKVMERNGVVIDEKFLGKMQKNLELRIKNLELRIHKIAGKEFNIASPLQLKEILFDKLKIATTDIKKIKTGLSTAAAELVKMRGEHEIIPLIEEYRELTKLQSTYVQALPKLINSKTGRVHTSFNQTITATGRLSSSEPNLQNIPIRTELGNEIRKAFVAPAKYKILTADYSQIELRIIASMANDKKMLASFKKDEDIHSRTASEIHDVPIEKVTKELRRAAKSINFGIIYGMGAYGLSQDAGISQVEAKDFIEKYFSIHKDIKEFIERTKEEARKNGYVSTLFGRVRYIPEINSGVFQVQKAAERMAVNMPIQGTAADIMKMAMIEIQKQIDAKKINAKMVLQVHDELVFEVEDKQAVSEGAKIKKIMANIYKLNCPIDVHINIGDNWEEAK
ncbi:MAG: DNA polymerase I [Patescibacteria group bacterium]|jgi:DNA polymerase-1